MSKFAQLSRLLFELEPIGECLFKSKMLPSDSNLWQGAQRSLFGGQVAAQSLAAAYRTVSEDRLCHSFHCYFLSNGDKQYPVQYSVNVVRDGRSFSNRMVQGTQNGKAIFAMLVSFSQPEADSVRISHPMPQVPAPDGLDIMGTLDQALRDERLPDKIKQMARDYLSRYHTMSLDIQPVNPPEYFRLRAAKQPLTHIWLKVRDLEQELANQLSTRQLHVLTTYMSDMGIIRGSVVSDIKAKIGFVTSLDHAVYFHEPMQPMEHLLLESRGVYGGQGRTSNVGHLWRCDGALVASIFQEAVVRVESAKM